ncbi:hypothetical protein KFL_002200180 [Klebsormidium nitens]|uniref:Uncharacterized protein n=1 Tax=Klebsormidium nitens TaxID=105231 RepID=A0A1Y1I3R3_KLENI|nr:hypothetical protein KFL_002200180 [Klebsormidium nitens]|eukprot:GAQ85133.1 hypothetical protein KFL_002200180 [Klebsormidium nitens]
MMKASKGASGPRSRSSKVPDWFPVFDVPCGNGCSPEEYRAGKYRGRMQQLSKSELRSVIEALVCRHHDEIPEALERCLTRCSDESSRHESSLRRFCTVAANLEPALKDAQGRQPDPKGNPSGSLENGDDEAFARAFGSEGAGAEGGRLDQRGVKRRRLGGDEQTLFELADSQGPGEAGMNKDEAGAGGKAKERQGTLPFPRQQGQDRAEGDQAERRKAARECAEGPTGRLCLRNELSGRPQGDSMVDQPWSPFDMARDLVRNWNQDLEIEADFFL